MLPLALLLKQAGHFVTGSDELCPSERLALLRAEGIEAVSGVDPALAGPADCVVVSPAIPETHAERRAARRAGIPVRTRAQVLAGMIAGRPNICVAGSHGKSTTTAMLVHILNAVGTGDFGYMLGASFSAPGIAPARLGAPDAPFAAEACEAHGALPHWQPGHAILTNIGDDHADHYGGLSGLRGAFASFLARLPPNGRAVVCGDDPQIAELLRKTGRPVLTYGFGGANRLWAAQTSNGDVAVSLDGVELGTLSLAVPGRHNVLNALAALGMALSLGIGFRIAADALAGFHGIARRLQRIPTQKPWRIYDDFAHHPSEIAAALATLRGSTKGRLIAILEPQLHSRVAPMALPIAKALAAADRCFVLPVAALGEANRELDGNTALIDAGRSMGLSCQHVADRADLLRRLNGELQEGDTVVVMAGGTCGGLARQLAEGTWARPDMSTSAPSVLFGERRPPPPDLMTLVAGHVARHPAAPAVEMGHRSLSYADLVLRVDDLSSSLAKAGVREGDQVGVCLGRTVDRAAAFLAILQLGGVFVPLDPSLPAERLRYMVENAGVRAVIVNAASPALPDAGLVFVNCDRLPDRGGRPDIDWRPRDITADAPAYMIFTSGTTGQPKAVEISRGALANYAAAAARHFQIARDARVSQVSGFGFDVSVGDMAMGLAAGACLVFPTDMQATPGPPVGRFIRQARLTHLSLTPSALAIIPQGEHPQLTHVIVAGEACSPALVAQWGNGRRFINAYGPTEATVEALFAVCVPGTPVTIGRPFDNMGACLLDDRGQIVAPGQEGELGLFGPGLANGYRHLPELTEQRFPRVHVPGKGIIRIYRTGDRAKAGPDGSFVYLGRMDDQLKFKGYRIETGELEAALCNLPGVVDGTVSLVSSSHHPDRLVAHLVVAREAPSPDPAALRDALLQRLPSYMVPSIFLPVPRIPRNANGKRDRSALPLPPQLTEPSKPRTIGTETEAKVMALIDQHAGANVVTGTRESLRDAGIDSLAMANFLFAVEDAFGITLDAGFEAGLDTVEVLALMVDSRISEPTGQAPRGIAETLVAKVNPHIATWPGTRLGKAGLVRSLSGDQPGPRLFWCFQSGAELAQLSKSLADEISVFGMRSGHLVVEYNAETLDAFGKLYADEITAIAPRGPLYLGGNCQGGLVMRQAGLELMRRGRDIALTIFMEQGRFLHYPGRTLLLFGEGSYLNPFGQIEATEQLFRTAYPAGHHVEIIPGTHGRYFGAENIAVLAAAIRRHIARHGDMQTIAPVPHSVVQAL